MTYRPFSLGRRGRRFLALALAACMQRGAAQALAANPEVDAGMVYCFQSAEFQTGASDDLTGICVTGVPQGSLGTVRLGSRVICPGDILTTGQLDAMTFHPTSSGGQETQLTYLPIYGNRVEGGGCDDHLHPQQGESAPVAENVSLETYKNLELTGNLTAKDPEDGKLTFTLVQAPKRGEVTIGEDGAFTYTPKKNKVGKDSFSFTATDEAGAVSNEATVTIEILKPLDNTTYQDMTQTAHEFEALWMKNTGLFSGSQVAGGELLRAGGDGDPGRLPGDGDEAAGDSAGILCDGLRLCRRGGCAGLAAALPGHGNAAGSGLWVPRGRQGGLPPQ